MKAVVLRLLPAALLFAGAAAAQAPTLVPATLRSLRPNAVRPGAQVEFTLTGLNLEGAYLARLDGGPIEGRPQPGKDGGEVRLKLDLPAGLTPGLHSLRLFTPLGSTGALPLAVDPWEPVAEPASGANSTALSLPVTVAGKIARPGEVDSYRLDLRAGDQVTVDLVASRIGSSLQAEIAVEGPDGAPLELERTDPGQQDPIGGFRAEKPGTHMLRIRDLEHQGGGGASYRLSLDTRPLVISAFPPAVSRAGGEVRLRGFNLGEDPRLRIPAAPSGRFHRITRWKDAPLPAAVQVGLVDGEVMGESSSAPATIPSTFAGVFDSDKRAEFRFQAQAGERVEIEVFADRCGSLLDPVVEVVDASGKPVVQAMLEAVAETVTTLNDRDSVNPGLRLLAWDGWNVRDLVHVRGELLQITALPRGPDDDARFRTIRGRRAGLYGTTPVGHAMETPVYLVRMREPGYKPLPSGLPLIPLYYRNDDGGPLYGQDSYLSFTARETGTYTVRLQDAQQRTGERFSYALNLRRPRPHFELILGQTFPDIPAGARIPVTITVDRFDGFEDAIDIELADLPAGFRATSTRIEAGETEAVLLIEASSGSATAEATALLIGTAAGGGAPEVRQKVAMRLSVLPAGDLGVSTPETLWRLPAGGEASFEVTIDRRGGFGGRVPLEVRNMPFGVRVQDVGLNGVLITESESSRRFTLVAEPWVQPGRYQLFPTARTETGSDTPTEVAAAPVTLEITPRRERP